MECAFASIFAFCLRQSLLQIRYLQDTVTAATWSALGALTREITALAPLYCAGDVSGLVVARASNGSLDAQVLAEATLSPGGLVVTLINIANSGGYADLPCGIGLVQHWNVTAHVIDTVELTVPPGICLVDSFELANATVLPGTVVPPFPAPPGLCGPTVVQLRDVALGKSWPGVTRTLVFTTTAGGRAAVEAALQPWSPRP